MPISIKRSPFTTSRTVDNTLRVPQARVLAALMPEYPVDEKDPPSEWPVVTRAQLGVKAGYTATSGTVTRALNGIREGSSSGDAHIGLLARGLMEEIILDIDGVTEVNYRITATGISAYKAHITTHGKLPEVKDATTCTNDRYLSTQDQPTI